MKSNDALPFVYVNYEFRSEIEVKDGIVKPLKFTALEYKNESKSTLVCTFNYDSSFIDIQKTGFEGNQEVNKRIYTRTVYQDGLSIFYYARYNFSRTGVQYVPVLMYVDTSMMKLDYNTEKTDVGVSDIKYDVASVYLEGFAYFTAVFGMTGDFSGWFSNDAARIPIKAKLEVKIGSVTVQLVQWRRKDWKPPEY